jgi:hypothetical protein
MYGDYNDGTDRFLGLFSDASDSNKFKLFKGTTVEPTTTVDIGAAGYVAADLLVAGFEASNGVFSDVATIETKLNGNDSALNFTTAGGDVFRIGVKDSDNSFRISNSATSLATDTRLTIDSSGNSTFSGNVTASRGFFNAGATNVVATFTSTDATSTLQCIDGVGNVEFGASGDSFVVQPAGGVAQLTVGSSSSTFAGNVGIGTTSPDQNLVVASVNNGMNNGPGTNQIKAQYNSSVTGAGASIAFGVSSGEQYTGAKIVHERTGGNSTGDLSFWTRTTAGTNEEDLTTEKMRITSAGNVGIGTDSPDYKLDVNSGTTNNVARFISTDATARVRLEDSTGFTELESTGNELFINTDVTKTLTISSTGCQIKGSSNSLKFTTDDGSTQLGKLYDDNGFTLEGKQNNNLNIRSKANGTSEGIFFQNNTAGVTTTHMSILKDGNVGIGETSPDTTLDVVGGNADSVVDTLTLKNDSTGNSAGVGINFVVDGVNDVVTSAIYGQRTGASYHQGSLQFLTTDSSGGGLLERMRIESDGKVSLRTAGAHLMFQNTAGTAPYIANAGTGYADLTIATGGSERMRITSTGNVGIGETNPTNQLHVHTNNDNAYAIRIEGSTNNSAGVWTGLGIGGESTNTKSAVLFEDIGVNYSRGKLHLCVNNELNQNNATPADAKLTVSNNGNVGIGTTTPDSLLNLEGVKNTSIITLGSTTNDSNWSTGDKYGAINFYSADASGSGAGVKASISYETTSSSGATNHLSFRTAGTAAGTNNTERMRITSVGNVEIKGKNSGAGNTEMKLIFDNSDVTAQANQLMGGIEFKSADGSGSGAGIKSSINTYFTGTDGYNDMVFSTAGTDANNAERMRITSSGNVLFNGISSLPSAAIHGGGYKPSGNDGGYFINSTDRTTTWSHFLFYNTNGLVGTIGTNGSTTSYNTSSDYRLKEDLQDFAGLDMVSKIPVYDFKWKTDESRSYGVMAHELQEVLPDAVTGEKDAEEMQGVDYSKIVPLLIKSIQELKAEIDILKAK